MFEFHGRFSENDRTLFRNLHLSPEYVNRFGSRFLAGDIVIFSHPEIYEDWLHQYYENYFSRDRNKTRNIEDRLSEVEIDFFEQKKQELASSNGKSFKQVIQKICPTPEIINQYASWYAERSWVDNELDNVRFQESSINILEFICLGIDSEEALAFSKKFDFKNEEIDRLPASYLCLLKQLGFSSENLDLISDYMAGLLFEILEFDFADELHTLTLFRSTEKPSCEFLACGSKSITFRDVNKGRVMKYGLRTNELRFLEKVSTSENVVHVLGSKGTFRIDVEYISGVPLENLLNSRNLTPLEFVKYSCDILGGLLEMREAGLYHRDIHTRNIIIDEKKFSAKIIDLGCASDNSEEPFFGNKPYSGMNDLVALGLIGYRSLVGHNVYNQQPGITWTPLVKESIRKQKEDSYSSNEKKALLLEKVRSDIPGELSDMIIYLLDDDLTKQPDLQKVKDAQSKFASYLSRF